MDYLPLFLDLRGRRCLVVGGGVVAERKISTLLRAHAHVDVVTRKANAAVAQLATAGELTIALRDFVPTDVEGAALVIAATSDRLTNQSVADSAKTRGIYVNAVDQPQDSNVIMGSIIDRSPVLIAIGTGGTAPVLARLLKSKIETIVPPNYGELAKFLGSLRDRVKSIFPDQRARRRFWEAVLDGPIAELLMVGRRQQALARIDALLQRGQRETPPQGEVYLIGTGPGDPDLLTFRALRLMQLADVIVHDRLVGQDILDLCRRDAERIYVGKAKAQHAVAQGDINALLLQQARAGKRVARLKGGDPFIFGRGGEEIQELAAAGLDFQVVPGITAALGCAAYAGIPLTHRDHAHSCVFITGHQHDDETPINWAQLVQPRQTVVVYMGLSNLTHLCHGMIAHGKDEATPAALIERGTTESQRVLVSDLSGLPEVANAAQFTSPAMLIVGDVVKLRQQLEWFERRAARP